MTRENRLVLAAAGAGKTTYLVRRALERRDGDVLITTYTEANEAEIRDVFHRTIGCIPPHIRVQTWFSFLIQHGVRPYQEPLLAARVRGLLLVNTQSARGVGEGHTARYYLSSTGLVYSDKLSKLVVRCNKASNGLVVDRISRVFRHILIDEVQDLAGYDLDIIKLLFQSGSSVVLVGDPRQVTYVTHHEPRFRKYRDGKIREFVVSECRGLGVVVDEATLRRSFRCNDAICAVADRLYPELPKTEAAERDVTGHEGVFVVATSQARKYIETFSPVQLTLNRTSRVARRDAPRLNFGEAKGRTFERVLIYPTSDMEQWLFDSGRELKAKTRAQLYVALTRAKHSVAVVSDSRRPLPEGVAAWTSRGQA